MVLSFEHFQLFFEVLGLGLAKVGVVVLRRLPVLQSFSIPQTIQSVIRRVRSRANAGQHNHFHVLLR